MLGFEIFKWITILLTVFTAPLMIWMFLSALPGLGKPKELEQKEKKQHRFAVLICARNEEAVIANLLTSLKAQDYPQEDYRIFVVADNCTDGTAAEAEKYGAVVFERFSQTHKGKGYALSFGVNRLRQDYAEQFDAVCVFDADNLAARDFLNEMNKALCSGAHVALGYRDTKNVHDSWVSEAYSIYWLMLQRFYHMPRHTLGLSSMVSGTGFAFKLSALGKEGWNTQSLTEDVEFSIQQICGGHKIVPARGAVFYDEQPAEFGVSVKQRLRWMTGGMQCIPMYFKRIIGMLRQGKKEALDLLCYLLFIPATGLSIPLNISVIGMTLLNPELHAYALPLTVMGTAISFALGMGMATLTLRMERRRLRPMLRGILLYPVFMFTMMCIAFAALVRPRTEWVPIVHKSAYTIEEIETGRG